MHSERMPRRAAIVGIDGSGKSALVRRLRERAPFRSDRLVAFNCPRFHDTPGAPLADLSRHLKAFSDVADALSSFELKIAALYLRMTLYGPVESFFREAFPSALVVSERHPLVDTLVYLPLYRTRVARPVDAAAVEPVLRARVDAASPGAYQAIRAWHEQENHRLGHRTDFWALGVELAEAFAEEPNRVLANFGARYRTALPDLVVLLDVDVAEAVRRLRDRTEDRAELHEHERALAVLSDTYEVVMDQLSSLQPALEVRRIVNAGRALDESLEELVDALDVLRSGHREE